MFLLGPEADLVFSASDLVRAAECPYASLCVLDEKLGRAPRHAEERDAMLARTAELGDAHEHRVLAAHLEAFGPWDAVTGRGVHEVAPAARMDRAELTAKHDESLGALRAGADVVFQASFFDGGFHGRADFLVRRPGGAYAVHDTKLARHAKVTALLQLAAYADQLERAGVDVAPEVTLVLGDQREAVFPVSEHLAVYRERRERFVAAAAAHRARTGPVDWRDDDVARCGRCERCARAVAAHRDVLLTAGMSVRTRRTLRDRHGVRTIDELAVLEGGRLPAAVRRLRDQAAMQTGRGGEDGAVEYPADGRTRRVAYRIETTEPVRRLPAPDPGDVFFDFEGDPLWQDPDDPTSWGLEYLFGVVEQPPSPGAAPVFRPFWAHSRAQERDALRAFLDYVAQRRERFPGMHVYHYADYEKAALRRLSLVHAVGEDAVDELLRENVLVDLYDTVRGSLRLSESSYSIKKLEPLYMGDHLRTGDVVDAGASVVAYADWCTARDAGRDEAAQRLLGGIADYNEYDCLSTLRLRDWLLGLAGISPDPADHPRRPVQDRLGLPEQLPDAGMTGAEQRLHEYLEDPAAREGLTEVERTAVAMVASATGYHRRERKQYWWSHFDRLEGPAEDWEDTRDVFVAQRAEVVEDWARDPAKRGSAAPTRLLRLTGRFGEGSTVKPGATGLFLMYGPPAPAHLAEEAAQRGSGRAGDWTAALEALEEHEDGTAVLTVRERLRKPKDAPAPEPWTDLPLALGPGRPLATRSLEESLQSLAARTADALPGLPGQPGVELLLRRAPRPADGGGLPRPHEGPDGTIDAVVRALQSLDQGFLAVQGPPGSGKTFLGSHVIGRLVEAGWRIGVVAQSHAVVENLLTGVLQKGGVAPERVGKKPPAGRSADRTAPWQEVPGKDFAGFLAEGGAVVGGTAWDFSNAGNLDDEALDLLVVDEAGQYSLANTLAVSRAARRLLLLGDPQQLPQVSQGTHPLPVDESALGWLSRGAPTLPAEFGYFLDRTWRMHPALCEPVSELSYAGRLGSAPAAGRRELAGVPPGLRTCYVEHTGNRTASPEEARRVVELAREFAGTPWRPGPDAAFTPLEPEDVLVVAAYNAQVELITRELLAAGLRDDEGGGVRVGTVDRFQGQEAPVVIVSMAASTADGPRGMEFLLSPNRLNVAVSRGQWCAVVVRSPALTDYLPATPEALQVLGRFTRLCRRGLPAGLP
ncbi:TM0106 family RecB-like putative nuclease [Kocuria sp. M1N1S27]|uniref:TM0106 family RecB-like putative nuclease n=1 Tax=Kocuria kalidii TaxID=3376283 RepID=UPI0037BB2AA1